MAPMLFAKAISAGEPIKVFNNGLLSRDFTYIDDIVEGTVRVIDHLPASEDVLDGVAYKIYNIGCGHPMQLMDFIHELEQALGRESQKYIFLCSRETCIRPMRIRPVWNQEVGYKPRVSLHEGIGQFIEWYKSEKNPLK